MRSLFLVALLALLAGCQASDTNSAEAPDTDAAQTELLDTTDAVDAPASAADAPAVYAVMFYADWCASCKALDPKVEDVWPTFAGQSVERVTLDFTDDATSAEAQEQAASLGLSEIYEADAGATGFIVLVNTATGEPVGRIVRDDTPEQIQTKVEEALAQA